MTKNFNKTGLSLAILFAGVLLIEFLFAAFFPNWTFTKGSFVIANKIISYLSFFGLIFFSIFTFSPKSLMTIAVGGIALFLFSMLTFLVINPIDSTTEPTDIKTLITQADGKKIIVRQFKNAKTNAEIIDTVTVKDISIFRKVFK